MSSWHTYPKLYNIGHSAIANLTFEEVTVEEKVDGSQFSFGVFDGVLRCRSKGKEIDFDTPEKMFNQAIATARELQPLLRNGWTYRGEYLQKPKHNTLAYDRTPNKNIIIFDINDGEESYLSYDDKVAEAARLGLETVPLIFRGVLSSFEQFKETLQSVSLLGGAKVEGVVIKNYKRFGVDGKVLMGKFVSEEFKELHTGDWKDRNPKQGDIIEGLAMKYRTPARWQKAIQHLRERGELTDTPKDIGALLKEIQADTLAECGPEITQQVFDWAWQKLSRQLVAGAPQWYKEELAKQQFPTNQVS